jgi:hypothetical protein
MFEGFVRTALQAHMKYSRTWYRCHVIAQVDVTIFAVFHNEHLAIDAARLFDADLMTVCVIGCEYARIGNAHHLLGLSVLRT